MHAHHVYDLAHPMLSFAFAQRALTHPSFGQYSITTMNNLLLEWTTYFQNSGRTITIPEGTIPILNTTTNACTVLKIDETFTEIFTLYFLVAKKPLRLFIICARWHKILSSWFAHLVCKFFWTDIIFYIIFYIIEPFLVPQNMFYTWSGVLLA